MCVRHLFNLCKVIGREQPRAQLESAGAEVSRLEGDGREMDERRRQLSARAVELEASAEEESKRAIELESEILRRREELVALGSERAELQTELAVIEAKVREEHDGSREATRSYREARRNAEEQNTIVLQALHARTEAQNTLGHQRQAREDRRPGKRQDHPPEAAPGADAQCPARLDDRCGEAQEAGRCGEVDIGIETEDENKYRSL